MSGRIVALLATGQVVLRLWAAEPAARAAGGGISVTRVAVNGVRRVGKRPAPTLLQVPLAGRTTPGYPVTVEVAFRIQLPTGANDRFGQRGETAWFGVAPGLPDDARVAACELARALGRHAARFGPFSVLRSYGALP